jgi:hypothetical protein
MNRQRKKSTGNGMTTSDLISKSEFQLHSNKLNKQSAVALIDASKVHKTEQAGINARKHKQPIDHCLRYHVTGRKGCR